jgi:hypothetical protein
MLNQPGNCVEAVGSFVAKRIKYSFGVATSTDVLDDDVITGPSKPNWVRINDRGRNVAPIRLPHEKGGSGSVASGIVMIGDEGYPVPHSALNRAFQSYPVSTIDQISGGFHCG